MMTMTLPSHDTARSWPGLSVLDRDGDTVGRITHIYLDRDSGQPEWALVAMPERGRVFVPLTDARAVDNRVRVVVAKAAVREAPEVASGRELSQQDEARLYRHYGVPTGRPTRRGRQACAVHRRPGQGRRRPAQRARRRRREPGPGGRWPGPRGRDLGAGQAGAVRGRGGVGAGGGGRSGRAVRAATARWARRGARRPGGRARGSVAAPAPAATGPRGRAAARRAAMAPVQVVGNLGAEIAGGRRPHHVLSHADGGPRWQATSSWRSGWSPGTSSAPRREGSATSGCATRPQVADRPEVQQLAGKLRSGLEAGVDKAASSAGDRLERARSAGSTSPDDDRTRAGEARVTSEASQAGEELDQPEPSRAKVRR